MTAAGLRGSDPSMPLAGIGAGSVGRVRPIGLLALALVGMGLLAGSARAQAVDPRRIAELEARAAVLEEEIRRLTGRLEEAEFRNRALERRIDQLVVDLDARLGVAAGGTGASGASVAPSRPVAGPVAPEPPTRPTLEAGASGDGSGVLGTLPREPIAPQPPSTEIAAVAPARVLSPEEQRDPRARYDAAEELLKRGDWPAAKVALEAWLADFPGDRLAPVAAYWLGETLYVQGDYAGAAATFARNYGRYGENAPRAPDNLMKAGMALAQLGKTEEACKFYAQLDRLREKTTAALRQQLARERQAANCR
jgi:tol-pal system protein YbgF